MFESWRIQAVTDVDLDHAYIFADNPESANQVTEAIFSGFDLLAPLHQI